MGRTGLWWAWIAALALGPAPLAAQGMRPVARPSAETRAETQAEAGAYLAARAAVAGRDFDPAALWLSRALAGDPADPWLLESALVAEMALGRLDAAAGLADAMDEAGLASPVAALVAITAEAQAGGWQAVLDRARAGGAGGVGPLMDSLARGWAHMGLGDTDAALAAFDEAAQEPGGAGFGRLHRALALAQSGDLAGAEAALETLDAPSGVLARARALSLLGRAPEAVALLDAAFADLDAPTAALRARLAAGEAVPLPGTPALGLAAAFTAVSQALSDEPDALLSLLYARAALALDPARAESALLAAERLEALGRPDLAAEALALVPAADPHFTEAELARADLARRADRDAEAVAILEGLAAAHPGLPAVQAQLGDALRAAGRAAEAEAAYGRAIALYPDDPGPPWFVHFARARARQAGDDWAGAEADLRRALALSPGQPQVLNDLGYGLAERGERLPEALSLIEEAVAEDPTNGAIADSLGWALFRLGRHVEAVAALERAAALLPADVVVNDHLGDAYAAVGRSREARFQWSRALSFAETEEERAPIRGKLGQGAPGG